MSIAQYQQILASDIVSVNTPPTFTGTLPSGADWLQDNIGNNGQFYTHRESGEDIFYGHFKCGWFGGGNFRLKKWVNDGWNETISDWNFGWSSDNALTWQSTGPGLYRAYSDTAFQFDALPWKIWCGQISGINRGDKIVLWDSFTSSLEKYPLSSDTKITVNLANAQRMGAE